MEYKIFEFLVWKFFVENENFNQVTQPQATHTHNNNSNKNGLQES